MGRRGTTEVDRAFGGKLYVARNDAFLFGALGLDDDHHAAADALEVEPEHLGGAVQPLHEGVHLAHVEHRLAVDGDAAPVGERRVARRARRGEDAGQDDRLLAQGRVARRRG